MCTLLLGTRGVTRGAAAAYCGVVVSVSLPEKGLRRIILAPDAMQEGRCVAGSQAGRQAGRQAGGPGEGLTVSLTQQPLPALLHLARSLLRSVHLSLNINTRDVQCTCIILHLASCILHQSLLALLNLAAPFLKALHFLLPSIHPSFTHSLTPSLPHSLHPSVTAAPWPRRTRTAPSP